MKEPSYLLTYFTYSTKAELDTILSDLQTILPKGEIVNLFIEGFSPEAFKPYGIEVSDKLIWAMEHTLKYAIDTEELIKYILNRGTEE